MPDVAYFTTQCFYRAIYYSKYMCTLQQCLVCTCTHTAVGVSLSSASTLTAADFLNGGVDGDEAGVTVAVGVVVAEHLDVHRSVTRAGHVDIRAPVTHLKQRGEGCIRCTCNSFVGSVSMGIKPLKASFSVMYTKLR